MDDSQFTISLKRIENFLFQIDFGAFGNVLTDEPEPLGGGEGPNPSAMLAAAVANCLSASLLFALRKHKDDPGELTATVTGKVERVDRFRRVTGFDVQIRLGVPQESLPGLEKAVAVFENFCTVTQSVRHGVPVTVEIVDSTGASVHRSAERSAEEV
jgi:uncharacterized OsmC-like protein